MGRRTQMRPAKFAKLNSGMLHSTILRTKPKHISCIVCEYRFRVPVTEGSSWNEYLMPLLLPCGHSICGYCVSNTSAISCPICETEVTISETEKLPLNVYIAGLVVLLNHRCADNTDQDFGFSPTLSLRLQHIKSQGYCYECGNPATVKCPECVAIFCSNCYSKIHGRALQNHGRIPLSNVEDSVLPKITSNCTPYCTDALSYFCNDCNTPGCSNCMLRKHKMHDYVTLLEKNDDKTMVAEFRNIEHEITDKLHRITQTKKELKTTMASSAVLQETSVIESKIAQHFIRLHGILQTIEIKLMNQLQRPLANLKNNLAEIETHIRRLEEQLGTAAIMANYTEKNFERVVLQDAIKILKDMSNVPCHLVRDTKEEKLKLNIDETALLMLMENHCTLQVPQAPYYCLMSTEDLPTNYNLQPLIKDPAITKLFSDLSLSLPNMVQSTTAPSQIAETSQVAEMPQVAESAKKQDEPDANRYQVELSYIINPSVFYVRKLACKQELTEMMDKLQAYAKNCDGKQPEACLKQGDKCIVKRRNNNDWERGRVMRVDSDDDDDDSKFYRVFFIDHGYQDNRVEPCRINVITEDLLKLPAQALRCCLYDLVPAKGSWTSTSTKDFKSLVWEINSPIFLSVIKHTRSASDDVLHVDLCINSKDNSVGPQSICSSMIFMKHAHSRTSKNTTATIDKIYGYTQENLKLNNSMAVSVSHVQSPDEIYVKKLNTKKNKLSSLLDELNEFYKKNSSAKTIDAPEKGLPCAAKYSTSWQRCEIIEVLEANRVKVYYVDIGCSLFLNCNDLRVLPFSFTELNAQAIKISLMFVNPECDGQWKPVASDILKTIFREATDITLLPRKKIASGIYKGVITVDGVKDVARLLKLKNAVQPWFNDSVSQKTIPSDKLNKEVNISHKDQSLLEKSMFDDKLVQENVDEKDPFKMEVYIKRVVTPDCIYVAQKERERSNAKLMHAMQEFYEVYYSEPRDNWEAEALCAVYSAKDKSYLRAKILTIKSPKEVLVYLYDMGIEETVTMADVQALHDKFLNIPTYCFKVKLAGLLPCGDSSTWPSMSCSVLSDIMFENARCKFYITKLVEDKPTDAIPVELWMKQIKIPGPLEPSEMIMTSVNRQLVELGVALPIKNYYQKALENAITTAVFKQQLEADQNFMANFQENVQWLTKSICTIKDKLEISVTSCESESSIFTDDQLSNKKYSDLTDWLPPVEIVEEVFYAMPTYVDNNCAIYLHSIKENAKMIQFIETKLQKYFESGRINKSKDWKKGDICIAQYHMNGKWYRGRVVTVLTNTLQVQFVDYGNVEECEIEHVTKDIKLGNIPIQCTKCVISGLSSATASGKWMLHDLDRMHVLLVDRKCKVCVLQRQSDHFVVSITLLSPRRDLLAFLTKYMSDVNMSIQIGPKQWDISNSESNDSFEYVSDNLLAIQQMTTAETSQKSLSSTEDIECKENVISSSSTVIPTDEHNISKEMSESTSSMSSLNLDQLLISSTPQNKSQESNCVDEYQPLVIPQNIKYIELTLTSNKDSTTMYTQLAENNDAMFSDVFRNYYQQFINLMSDIQDCACSQPLLTCFEKDTPCVAKFTDDVWYRCLITNSEKLANDQSVRIVLNYIDYGNNESKVLNLKQHDIHILKKEWLELPAMVIECKFSGIHLTSNKVMDMLTWKLEELYNKVVVARIKEVRDNNFLIAEVYKDKECEQLLYEHLIEEGLYHIS